MKKLLPLLFTTSLLAAAPSAFAQAEAPAATGAPAAPAEKPKPLAAPDKKFLKDATDSMYFILAVTGQGKTSATTEGTKSLTGKMKDDLDKIWGDVAGIATANGMELPGELKGSDKSQADRLKKAEGAKWDKDYLKLAEKEVKRLVRTFESSEKSSNPEIKAVVGKWKPTIAAYPDEIDKAQKEAAKAK